VKLFMIRGCTIFILISAEIVLAEDSVGDVFLQFDSGASLSRNLRHDYQNDIGNSLVIAAGAKYQIIPKLKLGANFTYRTVFKYNHSLIHPENSKIYHVNQKGSIYSTMLNGSYDLVNFIDKVTLYSEVGAGLSHIKLGSYTMTEGGETTFSTNGKNINNFTWSAGLGSSFQLDQKYSIHFAYRYIDFGKIETAIYDVNEKGKVTANEVLVSLRLKL